MAQSNSRLAISDKNYLNRILKRARVTAQESFILPLMLEQRAGKEFVLPLISSPKRLRKNQVRRISRAYSEGKTMFITSPKLRYKYTTRQRETVYGDNKGGNTTPKGKPRLVSSLYLIRFSALKSLKFGIYTTLYLQSSSPNTQVVVNRLVTSLGETRVRLNPTEDILLYSHVLILISKSLQEGRE
jgi:hypothetical protein